MNRRSEALAARLEAGANALAAFARGLTEAEWQTPLAPTAGSKDRRKIGVLVHHVASLYPLEIHLATQIAAGQPIFDVTWEAINIMNREHATENDAVTKSAALRLLAANSAEAAAAIRALTDKQLDRAVPVSLYGDAPLTCQFFLEDHAVRHSYHHLAGIKASLRPQVALAGMQRG
jgi:hypothetical protein